MIESFVDLTYRGLSLGKRIKLGQVRPRSGYLELAAPMPVGSAIAIATDDGLTIEATVTWVYEQVAGADRAPGMIVSPTLTGDAAAWWQARVSLPEEEAPRRITRSRPPTLRPRTPTVPTPPAADASAPPPTVSAAAELAARVAAAAGVAPPAPAADPAQIINGDPGLRGTGEHSVIDDGNKTVIMLAIDPSETTLDDSAAVASEAPAEVSAGHADGDGDHDDEPTEHTEPPPAEAAAPTSRKKRKRRR